MSYLEGTIEIPMDEFWQFVFKYDPTRESGMETSYGVPRIAKDGMTMEIDFAASTEGSPDDWAVKPKCKIQWDEMKGGG